MTSIVQLFRNMLGSSGHGHMGHNFRTYGPSFGVYDFAEYEALARRFYDEAMHSDDKGAYVIVKMTGGRLAIDKDGESRGIYDKHGNPLAFFRPSYRSLGFKTKEEELDNFRGGKNVAFS